MLLIIIIRLHNYKRDDISLHSTTKSINSQGFFYINVAHIMCMNGFPFVPMLISENFSGTNHCNIIVEIDIRGSYNGWVDSSNYMISKCLIVKRKTNFNRDILEL